MRKFSVIAVVGLLALVTGCRSTDSSALFAHTRWENAADAKRELSHYYKHVLAVCIYEDHWEDRGPNEYSLHHYTGTVVRVYKGDWRVSERILFETGLDDRAPTNPVSAAGRLVFVFTNQHADTEIVLDILDFVRYAEYAPALDYVFSK